MTPKEKKNTPAGKKPSRKKSVKKKREGGGRSVAPLVLVIMALFTVIVVMMNKRLPDIRKALSPDKQTLTEKESRPEKENRKKTFEGSEKRDDAAGKKTGPPEKEEKNAGEKPAREENRIITARIYLLRLNEKNEKVYLSPVQRRVPERDRLGAVLNELVRGASGGEKSRGYLTAVPQELKIRGVKLNSGVAEIAFSSGLGEGAAGSILVNRIDQIVYTATQFDDVKSVVITINGKRQKTLGGDGLSIHGPLHRR
jgi:spore germination protein GerM